MFFLAGLSFILALKIWGGNVHLPPCQAEEAYKLALKYLDKAKKLDKDKKLKLQKEILQVPHFKI